MPVAGGPDGKREGSLRGVVPDWGNGPGIRGAIRVSDSSGAADGKPQRIAEAHIGCGAQQPMRVRGISGQAHCVNSHDGTWFTAVQFGCVTTCQHECAASGDPPEPLEEPFQPYPVQQPGFAPAWMQLS